MAIYLPKGLNHGFGKKIQKFWIFLPKLFTEIFSSVLFGQLGLEIMLSYGLERKEAFENDENVNF